MTHRSRTHRLLSTLAGVWFALFSMLPQASLPCPMHASAAEAAAGTNGHDTRRSLEGRGSHAAHATMADALADAESPNPVHSCDCTTDCCSVPAATLPTTNIYHTTSALLAQATTSIDPTLLRAASRARLLPFANGPPALIAG